METPGYNAVPVCTWDKYDVYMEGDNSTQHEEEVKQWTHQGIMLCQFVQDKYNVYMEEDNSTQHEEEVKQLRHLGIMLCQFVLKTNMMSIWKKIISNSMKRIQLSLQV